MVLNPNDLFLVNDGTETKTVTFEEINKGKNSTMLNNTDRFLVNDGTKTETVTWAQMISDAGTPPVVDTVTLTEDSPGGDRFTNKSFTTTYTMAEDGNPPSIKGIRLKFNGDLDYSIGPIDSVVDKQVIYSDPANFTNPNGTITDPEKGFNASFGSRDGNPDFNFAQSAATGRDQQLLFEFPEPLYVETGIEMVMLSGNETQTMEYIKNGTVYEEDFSGDLEGVNDVNTFVERMLPGDVKLQIYYLKEASGDLNHPNRDLYDKYILPYEIQEGVEEFKFKGNFLYRLIGPFQFISYKSTSTSGGAKAKLFGVWLGNQWLNDANGSTELFFASGLEDQVKQARTGDPLIEVGNGDDAVGEVAFTTYIGDALNSTQNKIVLTKVEPNWDAGSYVQSVKGELNQYAVLDTETLQVTRIADDVPPFTPISSDTVTISFGETMGTDEEPDTVLPIGMGILTEVIATNGLPPDSIVSSNKVIPGGPPFLSVDNPEHVALSAAIEEFFESYEGDLRQYRAGLITRLVAAGFTIKEIDSMNLIDIASATAWATETGYEDGAIVTHEGEYWYALSSSYNNSPDDNDPEDWLSLGAYTNG